MIIYKVTNFFSTNTVKKIKAVLMDIFNYIDIPSMINIYRSAKQYLLTKKTDTAFWLCAIIYITIGDYLQVAYYLITVAGVNPHRSVLFHSTQLDKKTTQKTQK